jgi:hypothetical protein
MIDHTIKMQDYETVPGLTILEDSLICWKLLLVHGVLGAGIFEIDGFKQVDH